MKLSTGKVAFPIEFDNGDKDCVYFNPNDPDLMIRMNALKAKIKDKIDNIEEIELNNDGEPLHSRYIESFETTQNFIKKELDYAFGGDVSAVAFKHCSPFAIVDGDYFIVQFINAIIPEITKHIKKANAESEKRMSKHIDKYKK